MNVFLYSVFKELRTFMQEDMLYKYIYVCLISHLTTLVFMSKMFESLERFSE